MKLSYHKRKGFFKYNSIYGRKDLVSPFTSGKVRSTVHYDLCYIVGFEVWNDEDYFYVLHDAIEDLIHNTIQETYTVSMSKNYHNKLMFNFLYKR